MFHWIRIIRKFAMYNYMEGLSLYHMCACRARQGSGLGVIFRVMHLLGTSFDKSTLEQSADDADGRRKKQMENSFLH